MSLLSSKLSQPKPAALLVAVLLIAALSLASCTTLLDNDDDDGTTDEPGNVADRTPEVKGNPIITEKFTADPAALVYQDTVYLYAGHDEAAPGVNGYNLNEWLVYSSTDLVNWKEHPVPLRATDFDWASGDAWAAEVEERNGTFYWYTTVTRAASGAKAIGVATSETPTGPFRDTRGSALVTNDMTTAVDITWDDIDPTVFVTEEGQAYMFWGNSQLYWVKLKDNMIELEGQIHTIDLPRFTEAPWLHKKNDTYYLSYAYGWPEKTAYATSKNIEGPYYYQGIISERSYNCNTNHQAIIEFKGQSYFFYHNGELGGSYRRSVCIDSLHYGPGGSIQPVQLTDTGVDTVQ